MRNGNLSPQSIGGLAPQFSIDEYVSPDTPQDNFQQSHTLMEWWIFKKTYHKMNIFEGEIGFMNTKMKTK